MSTENYKSYTFRYVNDRESPGKVKVYVEQQSSYGNRDTSVDVIHRWSARDGAPPYICFKEQFKPTSFADAQRLAHDWADKTDTYIRTGKTISKQITG